MRALSARPATTHPPRSLGSRTGFARTQVEPTAVGRVPAVSWTCSGRNGRISGETMALISSGVLRLRPIRRSTSMSSWISKCALSLKWYSFLNGGRERTDGGKGREGRERTTGGNGRERTTGGTGRGKDHGREREGKDHGREREGEDHGRDQTTLRMPLCQPSTTDRSGVIVQSMKVSWSVRTRMKGSCRQEAGGGCVFVCSAAWLRLMRLESVMRWSSGRRPRSAAWRVSVPCAPSSAEGGAGNVHAEAARAGAPS